MPVPLLPPSPAGTPTEKMKGLALGKEKKAFTWKILKNQWYKTCIFSCTVRKK